MKKNEVANERKPLSKATLGRLLKKKVQLENIVAKSAEAKKLTKNKSDESRS